MSNYRKQDKGGNLFSAIEHQQSVASREIGILKLRDIIDWEGFRPLLEEPCEYAGRDWNKGGQPPFDPVFMFKVLILQKYHGLSDDATEEQIGDRLGFLTFLGLQLGDDIPDAKTIWLFKERIEGEKREGSRRLFEAFTDRLEDENLIVREGSFTEAPRQRNNRSQNQRIKKGERPEEFDAHPATGRQKDTDARWTKKNNESYYGYKNHAKVDLKSKPEPPAQRRRNQNQPHHQLDARGTRLWPHGSHGSRSLPEHWPQASDEPQPPLNYNLDRYALLAR